MTMFCAEMAFVMCSEFDAFCPLKYARTEDSMSAITGQDFLLVVVFVFLDLKLGTKEKQ